MVTGNRNILNSIKGITSVVKLTAEEKTALADRVLPANVLVVDSSNIVYLTDGVTAIKALNPLLASDKDVVHLTGDETIAGTKTFSAAIVGSVTGNAGSATKLATARTVNGTNFDGTANITTANWGTARSISITDGTNTSTAVSVNGSANISLNLPSTIKATFVGNVTGNVTGNCSGSSGSCTGNAATATQFSANTTVALTGDATGTSAGSKKGWSVPVTLANSGVTAGTYGPSADVTGNNNATISVPEITVDAKGRVTSVTNRTLTCKNNTYNVYNKTLTIQKNGTNVATFTSNSNTNVTANITVPTKVSELTNDSGFLTSHQSLSNYVTLNGAQTISGAKTFTGNIIGINKDSSTEDANSLYSTTAGSKLTYYTTTDGGTTLTNVPAAVNTTLESRTIRRLSDSDWIVEQICHNSNGLYYRKGSNGTWGAWKTFAFTDSSISGNAATATKATGNANGKELTNTIIKGLSISGKTITYTQIDGTTGTLTTQDTNTDTLMTQNVSTTNATYPILLCATADATANQGAKTGIFGSGVKVNPSTSTITATTFSGALTGNVTGNVSGSSGSCTGNAATATKLAAKRTIALSGAATGTATGFDGSGNITIPVTSLDASKLTGTASVSTTGNAATATTATTAKACTGNAATATKLATARTINGTAFNGTANITTANWGTARDITIADSTGDNTGEAVSVNGSAAVTFKLPATIKASLDGNAATATSATTAASATTATNATNAAKLGNIASSGYVQTGKVNQTIDGTKTFNSPINSPVTTGTWINGNRGVAIINSTANAGYNVLFRMKSSHGVFTGCAYDQSYQINYTTDSIVNAGTNATTYTNTLIDENGNATFSNNITVTGDANFANITASYITGLFTE